MVVENEQFLFVVTYVEAEGQFLKIWAQTDERIVQSVASMLIPLQEKFDYYGPTNMLTSGNIAINTRCCARGMRNDFLRAKVLNVRSDGMILVQFVDYGYVHYVPIHNIRLVDALPEANYLFSVPEAATVFVLADVLPIGGSWMEEIVKKIRSILVNNTYYGIYQSVFNFKMIKFKEMGEDFSTLLIKRNLALYSPSCEVTVRQMLSSSVLVSPLRPPHQTNNIPHENWRVSVPPSVTPVQKGVKTNAFKAIQLEIGSVYDVQVSYVEEGPCKFSVQLVESIPYLNKMMEKINSQIHSPLQEPPIAGTVCLGRQTFPNRLCRVVLNSPGDTSCKVYYADYGHHEVLPFSSIYQIPNEFVVENIFSIRFTLSGIIKWNVSSEMKDYFGGVVEGKNLKLRVVKGPMSPLTQYCDLFLLDGRNIKEILSETFPECCDLIYPDSKHLPNGTRDFVIVTFVESCVKFFIQLESDLKLLDEVMEQVKQVSRTAPKVTPSQIYSDMPCIVLYDDDQRWYRASALGSIDNNNVRVFYVDYGNEETVPINNLRVIPAQLVKMLPKQAIKCSLNGYKSGATDKELAKNFVSLVLEERLSLTVINNVQDTYIVSLCDGVNISNSNAKDIAEKLKDLEIAMKKNDIPTPDRHAERGPGESTFKPLQMKNQNDNYAGNWEKDRGQGQDYKPANNYESQDISKSKYRKENENEQRHDNRFRKGSSDFNGAQNNRYDKERPKPDRFNQNDRFSQYERFSQNDRFTKSNDFHESSGSKDYSNKSRFNRGGPRNDKENQVSKPSINSRLERSFTSNKSFSDKDSDTSSRSGGRRNNRGGKRNGEESFSDKDSDTSSRSGGRRNNRGGKRNGEDQRKRDGPPPNTRNPRIGRWENGEQNAQRKNYNGDTSSNSTRSRSPKDARNALDQSRNSELEMTKLSCSNDSSRYITSTPISKIPPPNITVGAVKNCTIVYFTSPSSFYVQLHPDNEQLNKIMEKISFIYHEGGKIPQRSEIKKDLQCLAQYSQDEEWYRAIVQSVDNSTATVHFVDYGNVETVSFEKIKEIEPEFLKLPAQGIHCKMFCPSKSNWTDKEAETLYTQTEGKLLEADFVTEENGVYSVLIKKLSAKNADTKYINDSFSHGVDLTKEKETVRNKSKSSVVQGEKSTPPDYTSIDEKWLENQLDLGTKYDVVIGWFVNLESFCCQLASEQKVFRDMMTEIQSVYAKRQPVAEPLKVGSSVIAVLPEDGVLYRAEVLELNKPRGHVVQYIDYGDRAMVDPRRIYPVERKFRKMPKQAIFCGLKNIVPVSGFNWTESPEISKLFNAEKLECIFHEFKNDKHLVSLNSNGLDVASALVEKNFATFSTIPAPEVTNEISEDLIEKPELPRIDINLLEGQTLHVKVSSVEGVAKFYVQFYTAETCQETVDAFMSKKDPQVMPRLLCHEVCLGAGCLVNCRGKWRRGVVINFRKPNYEVRLIDTGEHERISLKSMLGLPGQLAVMQNQAIECSLFDVPLSTKTNNTLKKLVTGTDVKIFVERVECNRLVVRLFDTNGNKIKVVETQNTEKIHPVCSMQILSSTHDVIVTWINNSSSVWLQRTADTPIEEQFLEALYEHYSKTEDRIVPEENELYAGLSADGNWYRVKVIEMKDSEAKVILFDYGNIELILVENLRKLEPQFYLPHQLGIEVSLTASLAGSNEAQIEILKPIFADKVFTATFYNVNRKWIVELVHEGEKLSDKLSGMEVIKETTITQFEFVELPEMVVGEKYDVVVSHADDPNQLWLQRKEELDAIAELQKQLQDLSPNLECQGISEEKSLCLAMCSFDSQWYRAEVIDADDEITTVRFIDYGYTDVINNDGNSLKQLPEKWKTINKYATQCKLDIVPANGDEWTPEACSRISSLATDKTLQALVIADKAPIRIDLFLNDQSLCKLLVDEKHAAYIHSSDDLMDDELVEEVELDPRAAYISNIVSIDQFWMQEDKWVNDLEMMEDRLMMASILSPITEMEEGLLCIAQFPDDQRYYRAVILSHNEEGTKVRYIDYGNAAVSQDLKDIPDDLKHIPPLSRKCCLAKPDGVDQWPPGINDEFTKMSSGGATIFLLDVIEVAETCLVKLTIDGKDAAMELLELCAKASHPDDEGIVVEDVKDIIIEERPSPIGEENSPDANVCSISYVSSPAEFWIQKKNHYPELDHVMEKLVDAEAFNPVSEIKEGKIIATLFEEDSNWYRSKILSHGERGTEVLYIDYGNSAIAESESSLRELSEDLVRIPPLSTRCSLNMPEGLESWPKSACEAFIDLVAGGSTEFQFEVLNKTVQTDPDQSMLVSLLLDERDVTEMLLSSEETLQSCKDTSADISGQNAGDIKDKNSTGDSAIQSELEHHTTDNPIITDCNIVNTVVEEFSETVEILDDTRLCVDQDITRQETVIGELIKESEKADNINENDVMTDENSTDAHRKSPDQEEKIVPGSVSRGISVDEVARFSPIHRSSSPEEKIVPGGINKGVVLESQLSSGSVEEFISRQNKVAQPINFEISESTPLETSHDDRIVPSCISKGEVPLDLDRPTTPKTARSDKILAGAIKARVTLGCGDEDE